jgi:hypothetical protein
MHSVAFLRLFVEATKKRKIESGRKEKKKEKFSGAKSLSTSHRMYVCVDIKSIEQTVSSLLNYSMLKSSLYSSYLTFLQPK